MKRLFEGAVCSLAFNLGASAQRLPKNVLPDSYDLKFEPNLASATFSGDETIHLRLQKPASSITLNSAEIEFKEVTITAGGSRQTATVSSNEKKRNGDLYRSERHSGGHSRNAHLLHRSFER